MGAKNQTYTKVQSIPYPEPYLFEVTCVNLCPISVDRGTTTLCELYLRFTH